MDDITSGAQVHENTLRRKSCQVFLVVVTLVTLQGMFACMWGQTYHTRSQRALRAFTEAKRAYEFYDYREAEQRLKEAISIDEGFFEAYVLLAEISFDRRKFEIAIENYRKALEINKDNYKLAYYYLGISEFSTGQYEASYESLKRFLSTGEGSEKLRSEAENKIGSCEYAFEAVSNPVAFDPVNLGDSVNTRFNEYSPAITADGNTLMFTREIETGGNEYFSGMKQEDFYVSFRKGDSTWTRAVAVGPPLNTRGNEGAQTIGPGGQYMYYTACDRPDGLGRCDIYYSSFNGNNWSVPVNIGSPVNSNYWESQPSVSADGKTLYFISNRPGGYGGLDIWITEMGDDGNWQEPVNAGDVINTPGNEVTPFIHFDGKSLYFSSNGMPNMGGYDIYITRLSDEGAWSEPLNIGYPINTHNDEMGLAIESNGYRAYYSSTTTTGRKKDLFYFDLHEEVRPERVSYLRGRVFDFDTRRSLKARYELINLTTGEVTYWAFTTDDGQFLVCLPPGFTYGLNVFTDGYLFYSENFPFDDEYTQYKPLVKDIYLKLIRPGEKLVLYNVLFNINSSEILRSSIPELSKLIKLLTDNKGLKVEIGGHTDDTGSDELNQRLSEERALAVLRFLTERGVDSSRLSYKGYGKSMPVEDNITPEGRRLNRRTEVKIVEINK
jgi:hypothetical protein